MISNDRPQEITLHNLSPKYRLFEQFAQAAHLAAFRERLCGGAFGGAAGHALCTSLER